MAAPLSHPAEILDPFLKDLDIILLSSIDVEFDCTVGNFPCPRKTPIEFFTDTTQRPQNPLPTVGGSEGLLVVSFSGSLTSNGVKYKHTELASEALLCENKNSSNKMLPGLSHLGQCSAL